MTQQVKMPVPVAWLQTCRKKPDNHALTYNKEVPALKNLGYRAEGLITTDQAEAYAAAKVREALEVMESMLTSMYTDAVKARVPEAGDEEGWNSHCLERALALQEAVLAIRALSPKQ